MLFSGLSRLVEAVFGGGIVNQNCCEKEKQRAEKKKKNRFNI
jgi:hypothetical protein